MEWSSKLGSSIFQAPNLSSLPGELGRYLVNYARRKGNLKRKTDHNYSHHHNLGVAALPGCQWQDTWHAVIWWSTYTVLQHDYQYVSCSVIFCWSLERETGIAKGRWFLWSSQLGIGSYDTPREDSHRGKHGWAWKMYCHEIWVWRLLTTEDRIDSVCRAPRQTNTGGARIS